MGYPKLFRVSELCLAAIILAIAGICGYVTFFAGVALAWEPIALMWTTVAIFALIYLRSIALRKQYLDTITFVTKDGIIVIAGKFDVVYDEFETIVRKTTLAWNEAIGGDFESSKALDKTTVIFEKFPVEHYTKKGSLSGYAIGKHIIVGFKEPLESTALAHELGHIIHKEWIGYPDEQKSHEFMRQHKLR